MSSVALAPATAGRRAINHWIVAIVVVVPTFMEILDTTVANVALRYIAGGLSAAQSDAEWVITSYLAANAIVLPITGWLSAHLGRRNYFLLSIAVFTLASAVCGFATSLAQMILFRVIQGLAGGGLQPCSQGILLDTFPPEKQGTAMTLFGRRRHHRARSSGPTLGGWLCVNYDWRWIFLINVPIGLLALVAAYAVVEDPDYLKQERAELRRQPLNFDYIGLGLLVLVMSCWEIMLSKGQEWDWLGDPFGRVQTLVILFVRGAGLADRPGDADRQPDHRLPGARRAELRHVLRHHVLRLRRGVRREHRAAGDAPVAVRLRRPSLRAGDVPVGRLLDGRDGGRRHPAGPAGRRPLADRGRPGGHGRRQLLDGADEPPDQPLAGDRAADGADARPGAVLRPDQRGRVQVHPRAPARGGGRTAQPAPHRGGQRRHLDGQDHPGTAPAVPPGPPGRVPRAR